MRWIAGGSYPLLVALATSLTYITCFAAAIRDNTETAQDSAEGESVLVRHRRATVEPQGNATFTMKRIKPVENITHLTYGQGVTFELTIEFPNRMTDMTVELFAPDNITEVMMLCNWNISHVGSLTNVNRSDVINTALAEGRQGAKWPYTRVVLNLGNVSLSGATGTNKDDYAVKITFDAVVFKTSVKVPNASKHWVSAGAEFNNDNEIFIVQGAFTIISDDDTTNYKPVVEFIGPNELQAGRTEPYKLDMYLPHRYITPLKVDIMAPLNNTDILSMCAAFVSEKRESYTCINPLTGYVAHKMFPYLHNHYKVSFDFGNVVNQGMSNPSRSNTSDHIIITFYMRINRSATVGESSYIGAAVMLGDTKIWAGAKSISIKAADALTNLSSNAVSVSHTQNATAGVAQYQTTFSDLTITTSSNTTTDISVTATSDDADIPHFHLCQVQVVRSGRNVPCVKELMGTNEMPLKFEATKANASWVRNKVTLQMRALVNSGIFTGTTDNDLVLRVFYYPTNNSQNVNGQPTKKVTFKVEWGGGQKEVSATITFAAPINVTSIANSSMPTFTFALSGNLGSTVQLGMGRNFKMTVKTARSQIYHPVTIEMVLPYDSIAYYTVCKAEIEWVGKGLPCLVKGPINDLITYTSKSTTDSTKKDRAVLNVGSICGVDQSDLNDNDYRFGLKFWVLQQENTSFTEGAKKWISAGMVISTTQLWVGQVQLTTTKTSSLDTSLTPLVFIHRIDSTSSVIYQYDVALFHVIIKIPLLKKVKLQADFSISGGSGGKMGICGVQLASRGDCITCSDIQTTYTQFPDTQEFSQTASTVLGKVGNSNCSSGGYYQHQYEDENSVVLLVVVKTSLDAAGSFRLDGKVGREGAVPSSPNVNHTLTVTSGKPPNGTESKPQYKKTVVPLFDSLNYTQIYYGQAFRMFVDVIIDLGARQYLDIHIGNRLGHNIFDIANFNVHSAGKNIPCVKPGIPSATYTRRSNSKHQDFAQLVIGTCANIRLYPSSDENNRVRLEVIGRVWMSLTVTPGVTNIYTLTFLNKDYAQVSDGSVSYTTGNVTDYISDSSQNLTATINETNLQYTPGQKVKVYVAVTVPRKSIFARALVDFRSPDAPGTDSAVMTVVNISFPEAGENLALFQNEPYPLNSASTRNTSQMDKSMVNLGIFQNTGVSHRLNRNVTNPDTFVIEYELQLADNFASSNGTQFWMSFGISTGAQILLVNKSFTVFRTGSEKPALKLTAVADNSTKVYKGGESVTLNVTLEHDNGTAQEPRNCYLNIYFPNFMQFGSVVGTSYIGAVSNEAISTGYRFKFPHLYFTDSLNINFTLTMRSGVSLPRNRLQGYGTTVVEFVYNVFNRTGNSNNEKWLREMAAAKYMVEGMSPALASSCNEDLKLHDTSTIQDCQITAFMSPYTDHGPEQIRNTSTKGWKPHTRGGDFARIRYITVLFGKYVYVTRVVLYAVAGTSKVTKIAVYKTMDGRAFVKTDERALTWSGDTATFDLSQKTQCVGLRVAAVESENDNNEEVAFKMNLYGCSHSDSVQKFNPCDMREYDALPKTLNPDFSHRGYLYSGNSLFYCDHIPRMNTDFGIQSRCFVAADTAATTWREMPLVGSVIGYGSNTVYGLAPNTVSYVMSEDNGVNWMAINKAKYEYAKAKGSLTAAAKAVPWTIDGATFKPNITGTSCTRFTEGNWNLCYDGIYHSGTKVLEWNKSSR